MEFKSRYSYRIPRNQEIAINLAGSQSPSLSVAELEAAMDHWKEPLDLESGGTIIWRDEGMRSEEGMVLTSPGITRSENLLADAPRKAGLPITAGAYVVVEFENGFRMAVDSRARVEKVKDE